MRLLLLRPACVALRAYTAIYDLDAVEAETRVDRFAEVLRHDCVEDLSAVSAYEVPVCRLWSEIVAHYAAFDFKLAHQRGFDQRVE